ncbi:MAG TPA: type II toxin-antitoxin system HicA family toxin [Verrucomicrobiae bacterium]|nr:type II toxin-antitoxin system HicA family toxin [Verrucomicrobiae bacterium]
MKVPRDLSGRQVATALCKSWGYKEVHQSGSHIILQTEIPSHQRLSIPAHTSLKVGTLSAIVRQVAAGKGVSRDVVLSSLFL